jgi:splicing factor, arginine/serine-rich 1
MSAGRVYIGNLPNDVQEREIQDIFSKYGPIATCDVKGGRDGGSRFAFVEYDDPRDASESVRAENGQEFDGTRLRVCPLAARLNAKPRHS